MKITFKLISICSEEKQISIDYNGKHSHKYLPQNLSYKKYWNSKLQYGRRNENYSGTDIVYHKLGNPKTLSQRHAKFNLIRGSDKLYAPYKFILLLMCLKTKEVYIPDDLTKIILRFLIKPRQYTTFSGRHLNNYILVKDLGGSFGTSLKITQSKLESESIYILSETRLVIEKVKSHGIDYPEGNFFRGIPRDYVCIIHQNYLGNLEEDREIDGECGFPYIECIFNGIKYFLIATERKYKFFVGRSTECDIFLDIPNISRQHCIIQYQPSNLTWVLYDGDPDSTRKSSNGTYKHLYSPQKKESDWVVAECNEVIINNVRITFTPK